MGEIRKYECRCGYEDEVMIGCGFNAVNKQMAKALFPSELSGYAAENISTFIENSLGLCENCKRLKPIISLKVNTNNGNDQYYKKCDKCNNVLSVIEDIDSVICPKCGELMTYASTGLWD